MIKRTYDQQLIQKALDQYQDEYEGLELSGWLDNPKNVALTNDNGDIVLFEDQENLIDTVCGHYFLFSRGKEAIKASEEFLKEIFSKKYKKQIIIGLTPVEHKAALWMNRRLGFTENGTVDTVIGPCKFVLITKQQWKDRQQ